MTVHYQDSHLTLHHGDALDVVRTMADGSVDCCITSPPYYALRDYGQEGQYGLEASPAKYVETMRALFAEVRRVLTSDGTLWLNLGDSYAAARGQGNVGGGLEGGPRPSFREGRAAASVSRIGIAYDRPDKSLLGIPWRVAFALQDDGWILRNEVIWSKPNAMPESVTDRLSSRHEHLFMLSKSRRYWFDLDPIREPVVTERKAALDWARDSKEGAVPGQSTRQHRSGRARPKNQTPRHSVATDNTGWKDHEPRPHTRGRNPGDVWTVPTQPFPGAHFAVMPVELARRAVLAGCKPGGVVLDPFSGSGTTGLAAQRAGRRYVGIDLNAAYLDLSLETRLQQGALDIDEATA